MVLELHRLGLLLRDAKPAMASKLLKKVANEGYSFGDLKDDTFEPEEFDGRGSCMVIPLFCIVACFVVFCSYVGGVGYCMFFYFGPLPWANAPEGMDARRHS